MATVNLFRLLATVSSHRPRLRLSGVVPAKCLGYLMGSFIISGGRIPDIPAKAEIQLRWFGAVVLLRAVAERGKQGRKVIIE